jgi:hypothetical protein
MSAKKGRYKQKKAKQKRDAALPLKQRSPDFNGVILSGNTITAVLSVNFKKK